MFVITNKKGLHLTQNLLVQSTVRAIQQILYVFPGGLQTMNLAADCNESMEDTESHAENKYNLQYGHKVVKRVWNVDNGDEVRC